MRELLGSNKVLRLALVALFAMSFGIVPVLPLHAQTNAVYVNANIGTVTGANEVLGYSNDGTGKLTPLPSSPYLTAGTGSAPSSGMTLGLQTDDDNQTVINAGGTLLFTVNGFSNNVSVFNINPDFSLTAIGGSPFNTGGPQPAALGFLDNALGNGEGIMVVVNKDSDPNLGFAKPPNFQMFTVAANGAMAHVVGSQITLPSGASPSQAAVGQSHLVFGLQFAGGAPPPTVSEIYSFRMQSTGKMKLNQSVLTPTGNVFLGEVLHPTQAVLYVTLPADNQVATYSYAPATGLLTLMSQVSTTGTLPCWVTIDAAGKHIYTGNTADNSIDVFDVTVATSPVFQQHLALTATSANSGTAVMKVDPTGKFLYAISNSATSSSLHVLNIASDGTLSETLAPLILPVPSGNYPFGLATLMK
jgi:hypothetical protein